MQKQKKNNGITLIALVVTIVVLLILAGVSITMIIGENGIVTKALEGKSKTEEASKREKEKLEDIEDYIAYIEDSKGYPNFETYLQNEKEYKLEWNDEFNGTELNQKIWSYRDTPPDNNEEETWTNQNTEVKDGILKIIAKYDTNQGYTSSEIWTKGKRTIDLSRPGRVEASIELPEASSKSGIWPAFWMMGNAPYSDKEEGQWPVSGEIDIMESINSTGIIYATVHGMKKSIYKPTSYDIANLKQKDAIGWVTEIGYLDFVNQWMSGEKDINEIMTNKQGTIKLNDKTGFHRYAVEWEKNENKQTILKFYLDEKEYYQLNLEETYGEFAKFFVSPNYRWYVILDLAVGGNWPGKATSSEYPLEMKIDYVRYYKK